MRKKNPTIILRYLLITDSNTIEIEANENLRIETKQKGDNQTAVTRLLFKY